MTTRSPRLLPALALSAGLTLAAASVPFAAAAQDPAADAVCDRGWTDLELRDDIAPEGVATSAPDEVWIAGGSLLGGGLRQASVLHGVGESAELELPPTPDTRDTGLMAIATAGPGEPVWAVGFARETDFVTAYATRRTDAGWELLPTPEPKGFNAALTDVAARGSAVWAAGFVQGQPGDQRPWALEWRADHWRGETLPLAAGERATLSSVSISDDGQVWVAGTAIVDADGEMVPYLAVRAGEGWTRYQVAGLHDAVVADIDMRDPADGWAVGHRLSGSTIEPLLLRWDGSDWSVTSGPAVGVAPTLLTSVSADGGAVSVGGTTWDPGKGRYLPLVVRLAESGSGSISLARPAWGMGAVTDIAGDPAVDGWVVGRTDDGLVARVCRSRGEAAPGHDRDAARATRRRAGHTSSGRSPRRTGDRGRRGQGGRAAGGQPVMGRDRG